MEERSSLEPFTHQTFFLDRAITKTITGGEMRYEDEFLEQRHLLAQHRGPCRQEESGDVCFMCKQPMLECVYPNCTRPAKHAKQSDEDYCPGDNCETCEDYNNERVDEI
jgi:hypothetical protein